MFHKAEKINSSKHVLTVDPRLCLACGACVGVCPQNNLCLHKSTLVISVQTCTGCQRCVSTCPVGALSLNEVLS